MQSAVGVLRILERRAVVEGDIDGEMGEVEDVGSSSVVTCVVIACVERARRRIAELGFRASGS